jgi:serine/threonine protein kinase
MLIGKRNEILLSDFGIVTTSSSVGPQQTQNLTGTWIYMAPEQISKQPIRASDQYSLAVVVYDWLCGAPPFTGDWYNLYHQHLFAAPPSLRERVPDISASVDQVVLKALAKDPKDRFESVTAFANALEEASKQVSPPMHLPLSKQIHQFPGVIVSQAGGGYSSIIEAIGSVSAGTRILVRPGVYHESIVLDKSLEIVGSDVARFTTTKKAESPFSRVEAASSKNAILLTTRGQGLRSLLERNFPSTSAASSAMANML